MAFVRASLVCLSLFAPVAFAQTAPGPAAPGTAAPNAATTSTANPSPRAATASTPAPPPPTPSLHDILEGADGPWRANNDLLAYHLTLRVDPTEKSIVGENEVRFRALQPLTRIQLDLTPTLAVDGITAAGKPLHFLREDGAIFIDFPQTVALGTTETVTVRYHGNPVAKGRFGGMSFEHDPAGRPWIFTADEDDGCSIWFPCKDQWADEPQEGTTLSISVPNDLSDISNGRLVSKIPQPGGYTQWNWHVSYPINSYDITLNIGAYQHFSDVYKNPPYAPLTLDFYALPEDVEAAKKQFPQANGMLDAFEHYFGEYPFARDGYKLIQVPYAGMEHQSAVAYGNHFQNGYGPANADGVRDWTGVGISPRFDFIIIHESGHEWFGNAITAADRADMWVHEGWDTYLETLYVEFHYGRADAIRYTDGLIPKVRNREPIIPERGVDAEPPQDQYFKGALMIATLRNALAATGSADSRQWFTLIRDFYQHFKYQNVTTTQVVQWWNEATRQDLTPFFNQYLRRTAIPALELSWMPDLPTPDGKPATTHTVLYKWQAEEPGFDMPVQAGDPARYQTLHPTRTWQTLQTPLTPDQFHVATDLFYINVSKT